MAKVLNVRKPMATPKFSIDAALKGLVDIAKDANKDLTLNFKLGPGGGWSVSLGSQDKRNYEHLSWDESLKEVLVSAVERYAAKQSEKGAIRSTKGI